MSAAVLIGVEHQLQRYNDALSPMMRGADLSAYVAPIFILYVAFNFAPTAVAMARHYYNARKIMTLNALVPISVFLLSMAFLYLPGAAGIGDVAILFAVAGGVILWISTMIDAATGPALTST